MEKSISESDDPLESILYFHPNSEPGNIERRISVVGQIVGTALCVKQLLSVPKLITLERGKFALSWSGRFILVRPDPFSFHTVQGKKDNFICFPIIAGCRISSISFYSHYP